MPTGEPLFTIHWPFSQAIMEELVPHHFTALIMKTYDGSIDPCNYLESFKALMVLQEVSDALMCKSFSTTFKDAA